MTVLRAPKKVRDQINREYQKISRSRVMKMAWVFIKENGYSKSDALHAAWHGEKMHVANARVA